METYRYPRLRAGWRAPCTGRNCWWSNLASWVYLSLTILSRILFGQIFGAAINSKHVWGAAWSIQKFSRTVSYMCSCSWYFWRGQTKFAVLSEMYRAFTWIPSQVSRDFGRSCLASTEVSRQKGKYNVSPGTSRCMDKVLPLPWAYIIYQNRWRDMHIQREPSFRFLI